MLRENGINGPYAIAIGIFLFIEGIWGELSDVVFGVLTTNRVHATIHVLLGIVGIWTGIKGGARGFSIFLGLLLIAVGVLRFVPGLGSLIITVLNVNPAVAYFIIVVGLVSLVIAFSSKPAVTAEAH